MGFSIHWQYLICHYSFHWPILFDHTVLTLGIFSGTQVGWFSQCSSLPLSPTIIIFKFFLARLVHFLFQMSVRMYVKFYKQANKQNLCGFWIQYIEYFRKFGDNRHLYKKDSSHMETWYFFPYSGLYNVLHKILKMLAKFIPVLWIFGYFDSISFLWYYQFISSTAAVWEISFFLYVTLRILHLGKLSY